MAKVRVLVQLAPSDLDAITAAAVVAGMSRSEFMAQAAKEKADAGRSESIPARSRSEDSDGQLSGSQHAGKSYEDDHGELTDLRTRWTSVSRRGNFALSLRQRLWVRDAGLCGICGRPADEASFHIDHIRPLSKDGTNDEANLQVSHPACNSQKRDAWHPDQVDPIEPDDTSPINMDDDGPVLCR